MSMMNFQGADFLPGGTFSSLGKLPRVPLPALADSIRLFEQWCGSLLSAEEANATQQAIDAFMRPEGAGDQLQALLQAYEQQASTHSWLDDFWPARYLGRRVPVSINANFVFLFVDRPGGQIARAAELVRCAVDFKQRLDAQTIPVSTIRGKPLCMAEYKYLFSTSRIPGSNRDTVKVPYSADNPGQSDARHIVVCCRGLFYRLDVITENGQAHRLSTLEQAIQDISQHAEAARDTAKKQGYLTTLPREDWSVVRAQLLDLDAQNVASMNVIEDALFCLCLDELVPDNEKQAADALLKGGAANRWFDKSISLIVLADGSAGFNCEHCGLDGTVVVELTDALHDAELLQNIAAERDQLAEAADFSGIDFVLDEAMQQHIEQAEQAFNQLSDNTATQLFHFDDFGSARIKSLGMSPDAFLQMAFQLAHAKTKGIIGATYESIATRHFDRGRTEAMRVVTSESKAFVTAMLDATMSDDERRQAFLQAADAHIARARDCQAGKAPEQHLWQLQMLAQQHAASLNISAADMALFDSPGWRKMRDDYLSTSSAPSDNIRVFGFGATSEQCIGVAYLPRSHAIHAFLSTPASVTEAMQAFSVHLEQSLRQLAGLLADE